MTGFMTVAGADEFEAGEMRVFDVRGVKIAVAKVAGEFHAFDDTCTHVGCSLAGGDLEETTVICPCHGSEFDVESGEVLRGPARKPVAIYETRIEDGKLEIEA